MNVENTNENGAYYTIFIFYISPEILTSKRLCHLRLAVIKKEAKKLCVIKTCLSGFNCFYCYRVLRSLVFLMYFYVLRVTLCSWSLGFENWEVLYTSKCQILAPLYVSSTDLRLRGAEWSVRKVINKALEKLSVIHNWVY